MLNMNKKKSRRKGGNCESIIKMEWKLRNERKENRSSRLHVERKLSNNNTKLKFDKR